MSRLIFFEKMLKIATFALIYQTLKFNFMKILMVCLGNICRSPLAEGILKNKIKQAELDWYIDSAGIGGWHAGDLPDRRSIAVAQKYGIDLTEQRARKIKASDLDEFDWILAMDKDNYRDILSYAKNDNHRSKVVMIMNFINPKSNTEVPDPYYDGRFELVYQMLDEACDAFLKHNIKNYFKNT
jgi:protein-tyrosine phosphatase